MSRQYEAVYVFDSALEDSAITEKLQRFHDLIGASGDITIDAWGRRQLAYKIGTKETGYYAVARFEPRPRDFRSTSARSASTRASSAISSLSTSTSSAPRR